MLWMDEWMDGRKILPELPPLSSLNSVCFFPEVIVTDSINGRGIHVFSVSIATSFANLTF
jgi:hypothetical protein